MGPGVPVPLCGSGCVARACREWHGVWRRSYKAYKALQGSFFSLAVPVLNAVPLPNAVVAARPEKGRGTDERCGPSPPTLSPFGGARELAASVIVCLLRDHRLRLPVAPSVPFRGWESPGQNGAPRLFAPIYRCAKTAKTLRQMAGTGCTRLFAPIFFSGSAAGSGQGHGHYLGCRIRAGESPFGGRLLYRRRGRQSFGRLGEALRGLATVGEGLGRVRGRQCRLPLWQSRLRLRLPASLASFRLR
jgi:hypothetical protein